MSRDLENLLLDLHTKVDELRRMLEMLLEDPADPGLDPEDEFE